jgi:hypothetical protein
MNCASSNNNIWDPFLPRRATKLIKPACVIALLTRKVPGGYTNVAVWHVGGLGEAGNPRDQPWDVGEHVLGLILFFIEYPVACYAGSVP